MAPAYLGSTPVAKVMLADKNVTASFLATTPIPIGGGTAPTVPSMDFSKPSNSQYLGQVI